MVLRYCLIDSYKSGIDVHPYKQMIKLGYKVLAYEGCPIGDCVFIKVKEIIYPLPNYLQESNYELCV